MTAETNPFRALLPESLTAALPPELAAFLVEQTAQLREFYARVESGEVFSGLGVVNQTQLAQELTAIREVNAQLDGRLDSLADTLAQTETRLLAKIAAIQVPDLAPLEASISTLTQYAARIDASQTQSFNALRSRLTTLESRVSSLVTRAQLSDTNAQLDSLATRLSSLKFRVDTLQQHFDVEVAQAGSTALQASENGKVAASGLKIVRDAVPYKAEQADLLASVAGLEAEIDIIEAGLPPVGWVRLEATDVSLMGTGVYYTGLTSWCELLVVGRGVTPASAAMLQLTTSVDGLTFESAYEQTAVNAAATTATTMCATASMAGSRSVCWRIVSPDAADRAIGIDPHRTYTRIASTPGPVESILVSFGGTILGTAGEIILYARQ